MCRRNMGLIHLLLLLATIPSFAPPSAHAAFAATDEALAQTESLWPTHSKKKKPAPKKPDGFSKVVAAFMKTGKTKIGKGHTPRPVPSPGKKPAPKPKHTPATAEAKRTSTSSSPVAAAPAASAV